MSKRYLGLGSVALLLGCGLAACAHPPTEPAASAPVSAGGPSLAAEAPAPAPLVTAPASAADGRVRAEAVVAASDRSPEDRALDAGRKPVDFLEFTGVAPGMRVADLGAGGGYTTELLKRSVGPKGTVYGQNTKGLLEKFLEKPWSERLAKPVMAGVVRLDREFDAPLPVDVKGLDLVTLVLFYHDAVWLGVDRATMNRAIFEALAPGGAYVIVDHSARPGDGATVTQTWHRIEESVVVSEVTAAGFKLAAHADFLKNPHDTRDWNDSPRVAAERRGTSDRFVLRFVKP